MNLKAKENKRNVSKYNEDILGLLEFNGLEDLEDNEEIKKMIEIVVNAYLVGGIYAAILQEASNVNKEKIENLMYYYSNEMLLHSIKMMSED